MPESPTRRHPHPGEITAALGSVAPPGWSGQSRFSVRGCLARHSREGGNPTPRLERLWANRTLCIRRLFPLRHPAGSSIPQVPRVTALRRDCPAGLACCFRSSLWRWLCSVIPAKAGKTDTWRADCLWWRFGGRTGLPPVMGSRGPSNNALSGRGRLPLIPAVNCCPGRTPPPS